MPSFISRRRLAFLLTSVSLPLFLLACLDFEPMPDPPSGAVSELVVSGAEWRYLDDGTEPAPEWTMLDFDDAAWPSGPALLGYGVGDESTTLRCHPEIGDQASCREASLTPTLTFYLRHAFEVREPQRFSRLRLRLIKDDGAIVYLNGEPVARANMRPGVVGFNQPAADVVEDRLVWREYRFDWRKLNDGQNQIAVELHLAKGRKATVGFDLELVGFDPASSAIVRGPYLQQVSDESALVRWRTGDAVATEIRWGLDPENLDQRFFDPVPKSAHEARLGDLGSDQEIFYRIAAGERALSTETHSFRTAPSAEADLAAEPMRVWITGGLGSGDRFAARTALAMERFTEGQPPRLWLTLGDHAFDRGSEKQFDDALFGPFADLLASRAFFPALGNRDVRTGKDSSDIPFYLLFDLPDEAQVGGLASGSEAYYSFDWGPVHFVCLDTVTGNLSPEKEMLMWLDENLEANTQPFKVIYFHHPPYSLGFFSTDDAEKSGRSFGVRQNVLPILEKHGVDFVLAGRTPSYERSFLLHGHYGTSDQLAEKMILDGGDGRVDGDGPYRKARSARGTIYVTAGGASTAVKAEFGHPAMAFSTAERGSILLDIGSNRLDLRYLTATGEIVDHVTLIHQ